MRTTSQELVEGNPAPKFERPSTDGDSKSLASFAGRTLVLFFYPKDLTSG
jgi:peroxiredoxin Q/BCP